MTHIYRALALLVIQVAVLAGCDNRTGLEPDPIDSAVCAAYPSQSATPYVLPYPAGHSALVIRSTSHPVPQQYAVDFQRTIGDTVVAARAGRIIEAVDRWSDDDHTFGHENHVFVQHDDGSVGRYFHLMVRGAQVTVGELVSQGQAIGRSGNSGNSTAPHLHFDVVMQPCGTPWPDEPWAPGCQQTLPVTFRNTIPHACGVVGGQSYTAR